MRHRGPRCRRRVKLRLGESELNAARKLGLLPLAARLLLLPPVNAALRVLGRYILPKRITYRLPLGVPVVSFKLVNGEGIEMLDPHRDHIARDVYWGDARPTSDADARVLRCVEKLCRDAETFVDIGAYGGLFAMVAARSNPGIRSIAYEILPENYLRTVRNVIHNDLVSSVECRLLGLSTRPGSIRMPIDLRLSSAPSSISLGSEFSRGVHIPLTTLDEESGGWRGQVVMKIDVEGFELEVLRGGAAFLEAKRPDFVCEVLPGGADRDFEQVEAMLAPLGYRFFQSLDRGLIRRERLIPSAEGRDWLFSTRADIEAVLESLD